MNLRLDVGRNKDESHFLVDGLVFELKDDEAPKGHPSLPGSGGPNPHLSGGARALKVLDDAFFIDLGGKHRVALTDGCWEMVWREDAPAGCLVCGFNVPDDVKRNDAVLPKGRLYVSLPCWSKDGLAEKQAWKRKVEEEAVQHKLDQKEELAKMQDATNPLMKALHYRNAAACTEKISNSGLGGPRMKEIPSDDDVTPIENDLLMCTKGTIWTKGASFFGAEHVLLGVATASADAPPELRP